MSIEQEHGKGRGQKVSTVVQKRHSSGVGQSVMEDKLMDWKHSQKTLLMNDSGVKRKRGIKTLA